MRSVNWQLGINGEGTTSAGDIRPRDGATLVVSPRYRWSRRTRTPNIGVNGAPAAPGGYVRAFNPERQSHQVIALAATGQLGMAAAGQIRLAVVRR